MAAYTQTYTFTNGTTADGGQVQTEFTALGSSVNNIVDAQVSSSANIAIYKTALVTYTTWTDYSGTVALYKSDGTTPITATISYCRYRQLGDTVQFELKFTAGSTPAGIAIYVKLPVAAKRIASHDIFVGVGRGYNGTWSLTENYIVNTAVTPATNAHLYLGYLDTTNASANWGASNNSAIVAVTYEAA